MDHSIADGAARYEAAEEEGRKVIRSRWAYLQGPTRLALEASGLYSARGERLDVEPAVDDLCEHLEYQLGVLKLCVASPLPDRSQKGAPIAAEALSDEVISSCEGLLRVAAWQEPEFLRLGISALAVHQQANALTMVGPPPAVASAPMGCLGAVLKVGLLLLLPVALAAGIVAAVRQDVGVSALAFYFVGAGVLAGMSAVGIGAKKPSGFEQAYIAWMSFRLTSMGVTGAGAMEQLKRMADEGIKVPSIAFDLAHVLRSRSASAIR